MEQNTDNKLEIKDRLANFYIKNKKKLYVLICIIIIGITSFNILKIKNENENFLIAEKYVKADLILSSGDKKKSFILLDEIILSRNSFYGTLALNLIIEKKLITDKNKILNYFEILSGTKQSTENKDVLNFKKALFLIKNSEMEKGNELLNKLIKKNSNLKSLAEEILEK